MGERTVVIVDDDKDLLDMLVFSFEAEGFNVKGIEGGIQAIEYLSKEENLDNISLIILDRLLLDMDGLDIINQLKPQLSKHPIPILFLSVLSSEKDVLSGLKRGAIDYVAKPFSLPVLLSKALALMNRGNT